MKRFFAALFVLAMVLCLTACGSSEGAGTYQGAWQKIVGSETKVTDEEFSLELKSGGEGTHHRDGLDIDVEWELNGEEFKMTETFLGMSIEYTGTLKDGVLDIFNGDPEDAFTYEYNYELQK